MYRVQYTYSKEIDLSPLRESILCQPRGFFVWFSAPAVVAHLATEKEQSREKICAGEATNHGLTVSKWGIMIRRLCIPEGGVVDFCCGGNFNSSFRNSLMSRKFPKNSIRQFLKVQAMSNLTTCDLNQALSLNRRIVTSVGVQQALNTVQSGKESKSNN